MSRIDINADQVEHSRDVISLGLYRDGQDKDTVFFI